MHCDKQKFYFRKKYLSLGIVAWALYLAVFSQVIASNNNLSGQVDIIAKDSTISYSEKLKRLYILKADADLSKRPRDSVYAGLLHAIAYIELTGSKNYLSSIIINQEALQINLSGRYATSKKQAGTSYLRLAFAYENLDILPAAIAYYDSATQVCLQFQDIPRTLLLFSKIRRAYLLFIIGDYQKCIEESYEGAKYAVQQNDSLNYFSFLNQKAQSHYYLNRYTEASRDVDTILKYALGPRYVFEAAAALKMKALLNGKYGKNIEADQLFKKSMLLRMSTNKYAQIADDYTDWGNFYLYSLHDERKANLCYRNVIEYARLDGDSLRLSKAFTNMSYAAFNKKDYLTSGDLIIKAMDFLKLNPDKNLLVNPLSKQLNIIGNKDQVIILMTNKAALLFELFRKNNDTNYLKSSIETALLTDSIITQTNHEHVGEQSKLYWRKSTRDLFTKAMEACYLAKDVKHAFYFMEKSRAVLLNDRLNEISASFQLSAADAKEEQDYKVNIAIEQHKLNDIPVNAREYDEQRTKLLSIKDDFEHFIKLMETKYPTYYQYKYADNIPSITTLQKYLDGRKECFIHYYTNDTIAYILSITASKTTITRSDKTFSYQQLNSFLNFCADKDSLNAFYPSFITLSNGLYKTLFQPLQIPKGRVVICSDNFLLPFEALCSDTTGTNFLINDYTFSYAYSATYLLKDTRPSKAKGNFIGFAPVSFKTNLAVGQLKNSASALINSAAHYSSALLFTNEAASKKNFIKNIGSYTVANVFSHASGVNGDSEPRLYMEDSLIYLSDLQLLNRPATRLVMLSACQTNVGRIATGEGIYSLARGFASAGIPAVSATLWKADEDMIYKVSEKFNEYLSKGLDKDIALHKAKLDFLSDNINGEKSLPYFWANMILIGNTEPLKFSTDTNKWWWIGATVIAFLAVIVAVLKKHRASA